MAPLRGHQNSVRSVAFSPDGKHIVSGSSDYSIRICNPEDHLSDQGVPDNDGWVMGKQGELLFWVPAPHRLSFHSLQTVKVIGSNETQVDYSNVLWGKDWTRCWDPAQ
ncbi:hypothetical protein OBBRIDRAFT_799491 [Obba rivulosa]|uniref:Uncharacterized protein n=1 Tax=Obba rivulosa TaxID=1052685 RepID=A0A8E2AGG6_9APHY|nr:hypothetical protein OBBRIDRAFT_799491 [Obba rivulosa]